MCVCISWSSVLRGCGTFGITSFDVRSFGIRIFGITEMHSSFYVKWPLRQLSSTPNDLMPLDPSCVMQKTLLRQTQYLSCNRFLTLFIVTKRFHSRLKVGISCAPRLPDNSIFIRRIWHCKRSFFDMQTISLDTGGNQCLHGKRLCWWCLYKTK